MDIGAEFEDDFFEKPKEKVESGPSNYEAKVCIPLWFMEADLSQKEVSDALVALKHQADFHYFSKDYAKAIEVYERCLKLVPPSNNTWKREFMENLARSLLHMDNAEKALEWSLKLDKSSFSPDQKIVAMNLLADVCHKLGKYKEELEALHCCIEAHKLYPDFWLRLGLCYAGLFRIDLPEYSVSSSATSKAQESEVCCIFNSKLNCCLSPPSKVDTTGATLVCSAESVRDFTTHPVPTNFPASSEEAIPTQCDVCSLGVQIVSSCLIHTKMLIDSGGPNMFGVERDEQTKEKITSSLQHMEVDQSFIDVASQMLGTNFLAQLPICDNTLEEPGGLAKNQNKVV